LRFSGAFDTTLSGALSGTGGVIKADSGVLTFEGANTYAGLTSISAGTLRLNASGRITNNAPATVAAGATFDLNGLNATVGSLSGGGNVMLGGGNLKFGGDNTATMFSGVVSGAGNVTKIGTSSFQLQGINTYSGNT